MREKQSLRPARFDQIRTRLEPLQIDIGRRRCRVHKNVVCSDPEGVSHKRNPTLTLEIADVMAGMSWCIENVEFPGPQSYLLAPSQNIQVLSRYGFDRPPILASLCPENTGCTLQQACRVDKVRGASFVDKNPNPWVFRDESPCRTGMIQVDVSEQDSRDIGNADADVSQLPLKKVN